MSTFISDHDFVKSSAGHRGLGIFSSNAQWAAAMLNSARIMPEPGSLMIARISLCLSIVAAGLALRGVGPGLGLPASIVKYGGSVLWGTMVFFLVAISAATLSRPMIASISAVIAVGVELFRLVHTPWLDAFRLTLAGALLLGRIFSLWDMLAYGVGIGFGALLDRLVVAKFRIPERKASHSAS
jgi:Protein of unknown function (DUF2809)